MRSQRPKVLHRLAGRPLLMHVLATARQLNPRDLVLVVGHGAEAVRAACAEQNDLHYVLQAQQRGTGHAVLQAESLLRDEAIVLVLYGDVPLVQADTLRALLDQAHDRPAVLVAELTDPSGYGRIVLDPEGRVAAIVEQRDASPEQLAVRLVNTGIIAAPAQHLRRWLRALSTDNAQGEYYLTDIFAQAAAEGLAAAAVRLSNPAEAEGVNDPAQLAAMERHYQRTQAQALMREGLRLSDPQRFDLRGELRFGQDVEIDFDVLIEGSVELGDGVQIGPWCRLRNCQLAAGTIVDAHSDLDGVLTEGPCRIGPYARLRPGSVLAAGAQIGNFVETKATRIGANSKASHLSYLGDAEIGSAVNIGAGTITCNYDGANKWTTRIGDRVFIGSNSSLVAPVEIGDGATIGAGSVICKDAPAESLTLARVRQAVVPGWRRPKKQSQD